MICIKSGKYGSVYVPEEEKRAKETKNPAGKNALDALKDDISRIRDEMIKKNRDDLDAMYNIDMDNMSSGMRKLFASWSDGVKSALSGVEVVADSQKSLVESYTKFQTDVSQAVTSIQQVSDVNSASIKSIVQWQSATSNTISSIQQTATEQGARIDLVVSGTGANAKVNAASITAAIADDESFIQLIADRVTISGVAEFVTKSDLSDDDGSTVISGNLITLNMNGAEDDGYTDLDSTSKLRFRYENGSVSRSFANIYTSVDGSDSDVTSRYALVIQTDPFINSYGSTARPAIKINAYGNISLESDNGDIYNGAAYGYILHDAGYGTRIRAASTYSTMINNVGASRYDYVFASDGIYYNGTRILST